MLYLLSGPDSYRREKRLSAIKDEYLLKNPNALGLSVVEGSQELSYIREAFVSGGGLFESKRLVIVKDAFVTHGEKLLELLDEGVIKNEKINAIFVEGDIEKSSNFSLLRKRCRSETFSRLTFLETKTWIAEYIKNLTPSKTISPEAKDMLANLGPDLWRLSNELEKLIVFIAEQTVITRKEVEILVNFPVEEKIFSLSDGICERNPIKALAALARLTAESRQIDGLVSYTINETRNLVRAKAAREANFSGNAAKIFDVNPFVWKKRMEQSSRWSLHETEILLERALKLDMSWKIGADKRLALEQFILQVHPVRSLREKNFLKIFLL